MTDEPTPPQPVLDHAELSQLRLRIINGYEPTMEEMQAVTQTVRANNAAQAPKEKKEKTKGKSKRQSKAEIAEQAAALDLTDLMTSELP